MADIGSTCVRIPGGHLSSNYCVMADHVVLYEALTPPWMDFFNWLNYQMLSWSQFIIEWKCVCVCVGVCVQHWKSDSD